MLTVVPRRLPKPCRPIRKSWSARPPTHAPSRRSSSRSLRTAQPRLASAEILRAQRLILRAQHLEHRRLQRRTTPGGETARWYRVQLAFDPEVEAFRAEFAAFLDGHLPPESKTLERPRSV